MPSSLRASPLEFADKGNGVYTASIDAIYGEWKIVKNNSWAFTLSNGDLGMEPDNTYDLQRDFTNSGFATGKLLKDAKLTLTIKDDGSATLKVEGTLVEHSYSLVGEFNKWILTDGPFLTHQEDGSWTADIKDFLAEKSSRFPSTRVGLVSSHKVQLLLSHSESLTLAHVPMRPTILPSVRREPTMTSTWHS